MAARRTAARPKRGRPAVHEEAWSKVSVVLMDRQIQKLDGFAGDIHKASGAVITRAAIIRALVDGVVEGGVNLARFTSERELRAYITSQLKRTRRAPPVIRDGTKA